MSNEWKIAQGLKKQNQNKSLSIDSIISEERLNEFINNQEEISKKIWFIQKRENESHLEEIPDIPILSKEFEEENIEILKECILKCIQEDKRVSGKLGDISFFIDEKNPKKVTFIGENRNYNITIDGDDMFSEVDFYRYETLHYIKDGYAINFVPMTRTITVINGEEFSESYRIEEFYDKEVTEAIIQDALSVYTDYEKSGEDELYRNNIDSNEEIRTFIKPISARKGLLESVLHGEKVDLEPGFYKYSRIPEKCKTYSEYAIPAKKIEKNCKYLYSLIVEAYQSIKKINEQEKMQDSIENTQSTYKINEFSIDELSDEELDKFIEDMDAKQREKEQQIDRLKKIKRAKELISLSKQQDKEIADLESQIQKEGMAFDE